MAFRKALMQNKHRALGILPEAVTFAGSDITDGLAICSALPGHDSTVTCVLHRPADFCYLSAALHSFIQPFPSQARPGSQISDNGCLDMSYGEDRVSMMPQQKDE